MAAVQHSIVKSTTDKISVQRDAILEKVSKIIEAAAASKVNIICFQEAFSEFEFAFEFYVDTSFDSRFSIRRYAVCVLHSREAPVV